MDDITLAIVTLVTFSVLFIAACFADYYGSKQEDYDDSDDPQLNPFFHKGPK